MKFISHSLKETDLIAKQIASHIKPNDIVALTGDLGAGKTTLTSFLVKHLGSRDMVSSPTFSLVNHYKSNIDIFHFDMYRISSEDDLYSIGFFDYINNNNILLIEWFENISEFVDGNIIIDLSFVDESSRNITVTFNGGD